MGRFRTPIVCVAWLALVIALALGVDRVIAARIFARPTLYVPGYRGFGDYTTGTKLWMFRHSPAPDVMFIGNSRMLFAVDPLQLDPVLARRGVRERSFNLAFASVDLSFWQSFFAAYYTRPMPRTVVLALTPRDLDATYAFDQTAFFDSPGYQNRDLSPVSDRAENALGRTFVLWGRHSETRAIPPRDLLDGTQWDPDVIEVADDRGWGKFPVNHQLPEDDMRQAHRGLADRHGPGRLQVTDARRAALDYVRARVCAAGGRLVLSTLPVYYDEERWGTVEYRRDLRRLLAAYSRQTGVPLVDAATATLPRLQDPGLWGNGDHLNAKGTRAFAPMYGDLLAPVLRRRGRPGC